MNILKSLLGTSGSALSSDAWMQRYERANWQTITYIASHYADDPRYEYTARVPIAEAERLAVQAKSGALAGTFSDTKLCAGAGAFLRATAPGDFITYSVPVHQPGNYVVRAGVQTRSNKGKFQLAIDGVKQGRVQDEYSPSLGNGFRDLGTAGFLSTGTQLFNFKVTGRNPSSTGYTLAFDYIDLIPSDRWEIELAKVQAVTPVPAGYTSAERFGVFNASAANGGAGTYLNATAAGNYITYTVPVAKSWNLPRPSWGADQAEQRDIPPRHQRCESRTRTGRVCS